MRVSTIVSTMSSMPSALRKRCWLAGWSSAVHRQLKTFSSSSASSASAGSLRLKCEAAVSSGRMPSALPRAIWFSGWSCRG